jgi:hypothetical protein
MAAERDFRARVELAERLGVPPSQLDGREPESTTVHEYDDAGRIVRSTTTAESRYTEQDRAELLAIAVYRDGLCSVCGGPATECQSHEATGPKFKPSRLRCRRSDAVLVAKSALQNTDRPEALAWFTTTVRR